MEQTLEQVTAGEDLTFETARSAADTLVTEATDAEIGALLGALRTKGLTEVELAGFAQGVRDNSLTIDPTARPLVDTCGTGGDAYDTINISTASAFVAAAAGVPIAKHGNHGVSSSAGSSDVMAELGLSIDRPPSTVEQQIDRIGFGYLHAPTFHPAMKAVTPARQDLGIPTVFNLIGPLTNPAGATRQVLGAHGPEALDLLAGAVAQLEVEHALVVHGSGLDEIAVHGETTVAEVRGDAIDRYTLSPVDLGIDRYDVGDIAGGSPSANATALREILAGEQAGAQRAVVAANAGAALYVGGEADSIADGVELARSTLIEGAPRTLVSRLAETQVSP